MLCHLKVMHEGNLGDGSPGLNRVLALCVVIFFADASHSLAIPVFPFYARYLGASLGMIGVLASATGLTTMLLAIPMGLLSDRVGRKSVMALGMMCFTMAPLAYSISPSPLSLLPARIVLGVGMASTFSIGFVYVSEVAPQGRRSLIQGLYMTSMGIGFTLGPLIGGISAKAWSYVTSFYLSSVLALMGVAILLLTPDAQSMAERKFEPMAALSDFKRVLSNSRIVAAGMANFFNSMLYSTTMVYFPLYGRSLGFDESQVGLGLTVRGLVSTLSRMPTGALIARSGALRLIVLGLGVSAATLFSLSAFDGLTVISVILGIQGATYGVYLTAGNVYVAGESPEEMRGASMGVYSVFSNVSGVLSPLIMGTISEAWGFKGAFRMAAVLALLGAIITVGTSRRGGGDH
jgi:DHA1 family multidrug resistance protein-like MFS transporter